MRLCFLSDYSGRADEGIRNLAFYLGRELSRNHHVLHLQVWNMFTPGFWRQLRAFHPDIIHFFPGPTIKSFIIVKVLHAFCPRAKTVMSAPNPVLSRLSEKFVPWLKPDLIIAQSAKTGARFGSMGCNVGLLTSGVDTKRFVPVTAETKEKLRKKYSLDVEKKLVLHVGPIKRGRNILVFIRMQQRAQVLVVGSLSVAAERNVYDILVKGGCLVWRSYLPNVEEIYALADCYVFPTTHKQNSIEHPLSVMEAMSCDLPVISTRFGALPELFSPGQGLYFADTEEEFISSLEAMGTDETVIRTREKVLPYSWGKVARRLENIYSGML